MDLLEKPVAAVSKCLGFERCRYDGTMIVSPGIESLKSLVHFVPLCPEVEIGLGVPRPPIRAAIQNGEKRLIQPDTARDITDLMMRFLESVPGKLPAVDGFILKEKSPSCGIHQVKIYHEPGKAQPAAYGQGFFGGYALERYAHLPIENEIRLTDAGIMDYFLTRLFAVFRFRRLKSSPSFQKLVDFQARNKLIFMAYNQVEMRRMGKIVANLEKKTLPAVLAGYEEHLYRVFSRMSRHASHVNVLMHALGYVAGKVTAAERRDFLRLLEQYRQGQVALAAPRAVMQSWILRFHIEYLQNQTYFTP